MPENGSNDTLFYGRPPETEKVSRLSEREKDPGIRFSRKSAGFVLLIIMLFFFLNLFFALATILMGPALFVPELEGKKFSIFLGFTEIGGGGSIIYYLILTAIIVLSFYKAFKDDGKELLELATRELGPGPGENDGSSFEWQRNPPYEGAGKKQPYSPSLFSPYLNNTFVLLALLFFSIFAFEFIFDIVVSDILGISRHIPSSLFDVPVWRRVLRLPEAPVVEEITDRVLLIGIPLYFIHNYGVRKERKKRNEASQSRPEDAPAYGSTPSHEPPPLHDRYPPFHLHPGSGQRPDLFGYDDGEEDLLTLICSLFKKENRRYILGGGFEWSTQTVLLLFFSSTFFAVLHLGWDWTKLIPTFLGGMVLGALFLRKGLHACILLHFAINSFSITYLVAGEPLVLEIVLYIVYFGGIIFGSYYLYYYLKFFRRKLSEVDLDIRSSEFSKAMAALGGVTLFLFAIAGLFYLGLFTLDEGLEEHTEEHYLQLGEGDYQIFELGDFGKDEHLNGSLVLVGESGEMEFFVANGSLKNEWKEKGDDVAPGEFLLYLHAKLDSKNATTSRENPFKLDFDGGGYDIFLILHAREDSCTHFSYTTTTISMERSEKWCFAACGIPVILILTGLGLSCIYTSNYYNFTKFSRRGHGYGPRYQPPPPPYGSSPYRHDQAKDHPPTQEQPPRFYKETLYHQEPPYHQPPSHPHSYHPPPNYPESYHSRPYHPPPGRPESYHPLPSHPPPPRHYREQARHPPSPHHYQPSPPYPPQGEHFEGEKPVFPPEAEEFGSKDKTNDDIKLEDKKTHETDEEHIAPSRKNEEDNREEERGGEES